MADYLSMIPGFIKENEKIILIACGIVIFLLFTLFRNKLANGLLKLIATILFRKKDEYKESFVKSLKRPLSMFFFALGLFLALKLNIHSVVLTRVFKIAVILIIAWAIVCYLSDNLYLMFKFGNSTNDKMNATVIKFISNVLKIVIIAIAVVMVISELGYNINGLLTGIGVGGLAVSLAAQDAISNLISGFVIVLDQPFLVGDFIQTNSIQGTVIDITMRSTKIRTLEDSIVTIPNSKIADDDIINLTSMEKRLIDFDLSLVYATSNKKLRECQTKLTEFLNADKHILAFPVRVNFSKLDDSSLNLTVFCYTDIVEVNEYLRFYSDLNFRVKEIVEQCGIEFAFPSTSVYIEKN